jgi:hypothetical protein
MTTSPTGMLPSGTGTSSGAAPKPGATSSEARRRPRAGSAGIGAAGGVQRSGSSLAQRPIWPPAVGLPTATPRSGRLLRDRDRPVADRALPKLTDNRLIAYGSAAVISERRADELRRRCAIAHP